MQAACGNDERSIGEQQARQDTQLGGTKRCREAARQASHEQGVEREDEDELTRNELEELQQDVDLPLAESLQLALGDVMPRQDIDAMLAHSAQAVDEAERVASATYGPTGPLDSTSAREYEQRVHDGVAEIEDVEMLLGIDEEDEGSDEEIDDERDDES